MRNLGQDQKSRRRVIVVFLGTVLLPSLILAYMGLRYIKQEERWQGQLAVQNLRVALSNAVHSLEATVYRHVLETFDSLTSRTSLPAVVEPFQLHAFSQQHSLVEEVLLLDQNRGLQFPRAFRSRSRSSREDTMLESAALKEYLVKGEEHEARGRTREALAEFSAGLDRADTKRARLAFLVRIARCLHRTGALDDADQAYRQVLDEDGGRYWGEELPYRFVALARLAEISRRQGKPMRSFDYLSTAYGEMVTQFHRFEQATFEYHRDRVQMALRSIAEEFGPRVVARLDSLSRLEEVFRSEPERRRFLERHVMGSIARILRSRAQPDALRFVAVDAGDSSVYFALLDGKNGRQDRKTLGIRLRNSALTALELESTRGVTLGEKLRLALLDSTGTLLDTHSSQSVTVVLDEPLNLLAGTLKGHRLAVVGLPGTAIEEITSRSLTMYYVLIGIIIVVILLGILFLYHETSRERELARMKSEFISNVTHEIKTPIATIRTLADNVNEGWVRSTAKHERYFRLIARESERLGHLVENTLDFSRIESGRKRYRMETGSPREVIQNTVSRFRTLTEGHGVEITCTLRDPLPPISMDEVAIGQALMNLLDNAVKYSREKKVVAVTASVDLDEIRIAVADAGIGMDPKEISRIFEKFYRSEPAGGKKVAGSGIGLTLVKETVEAHGGRVEVRSERNRGSTFTIILPAARKDSHAHSPAD